MMISIGNATTSQALDQSRWAAEAPVTGFGEWERLVILSLANRQSPGRPVGRLSG
jgi:hypothetical protein